MYLNFAISVPLIYKNFSELTSCTKSYCNVKVI